MKKLIRKSIIVGISALMVAFAVTGCDDPTPSYTKSTGSSVNSMGSIESDDIASDDLTTSYDSYITLETENVSDAKNLAENACIEAGGRVRSSSYSYDDADSTGYARLVCEIPNESFYEAVNAIRVLGDIQSENIEISYIDPETYDAEDDVQWKHYGYSIDRSKMSELAVTFVDNTPAIVNGKALLGSLRSSVTSILYLIVALIPAGVIALIVVGIMKVVKKRRPTDTEQSRLFEDMD